MSSIHPRLVYNDQAGVYGQRRSIFPAAARDSTYAVLMFDANLLLSWSVYIAYVVPGFGIIHGDFIWITITSRL